MPRHIETNLSHTIALTNIIGGMNSLSLYNMTHVQQSETRISHTLFKKVFSYTGYLFSLVS